ncbi:Protein white [Nymphon striatum]|nr:Protein white [Nymphon striatum]
MHNQAFTTEIELKANSQSSSIGVSLKWTDVNVFSVPKTRKCAIFPGYGKNEPTVQILKNATCRLCDKQNMKFVPVAYEIYGMSTQRILNEFFFYFVVTVNGEAKPGEIVAIMGSSGSGKTTLLNVLNRKNCGSFKVSGSIRVNNKKMDKKFAKLSAYVQQDDLFYPTLTVKEHLKFQAALRMDRHIRHEERMSKVDKVIIDFGLKKCENTKIGGVLLQMVFKGISGGEKKRLAIASEVLTNPSVLFLDEPTSGLDSFMAESVIDSLINLARLGRTVICTIHQPSSQLFSKFDKLMLLSNGRVAFFGSLTDAEVFFSQCGLACPRLFNPADHYIYSLAVVPGDEERSKGAISMSALVVGVIYLQQKYDGKGIMNINGALFLTLTQLTFPYFFGVLSTFCPELPLFLREHWNGMYRTDTYFLAKNIAESGYLSFQETIYILLTYYKLKIRLTVTKIFSGSSVPVYLVWMKHLSWFNYGFEIMLVNEWSGVDKTREYVLLYFQ